MGGKKRDIANLENDRGELPKRMTFMEIKINHWYKPWRFLEGLIYALGKIKCKDPETSLVLGGLKD